MSIDELKRNLTVFTENNIGAEFYFILNNGNATLIKSADIDQGAQASLKDKFIDYIRSTIIDNQDLSLLPLSSADDRREAIYIYDLDEIPGDLQLLDDILGDEELPTFTFGDDEMSNIKGIMILIGNDEDKVALFKKHYPVSLIRRDSSFLMRRRSRSSRFVELESDVLRVNSSFEFFKLNGTYYICNINALEKFFGFHDIIRREANRSITAIAAADIVDNPEFLAEATDNISFARKLTKVLSNSPVLNRIPNNEIISFVESHPTLSGKLKANDDNTKFHLHTKKSRDLFVKLLNDDYLKSLLTAHHYDSLAKDTISTG